MFRAYTDPEVVLKWLGPRNLTMTIEKFDSVPGGSYHYSHERGGVKFFFRGVNHEVTAPERIINTFEFEGLPEPGHVAMQTARFEELPGGRCRVVAQSVFQSVTDRDGMIASGMERGVTEGFERLDALLAEAAVAKVS